MATLGEKIEVHFTTRGEKGVFFDTNISRAKNLVRYGASPQEIVSKLGVSPEEAFLLIEAAKILLM